MSKLLVEYGPIVKDKYRAVWLEGIHDCVEKGKVLRFPNGKTACIRAVGIGCGALMNNVVSALLDADVDTTQNEAIMED